MFMKLKINKPGNTPLIKAEGMFGIKNLFVKDETKHPTHTFKDRSAYEMIAPIIRKIENGKTPNKITFGAISYGNMALSMGYYTNLLNSQTGKEIAKSIIFIPHDLEERKFGPDTEGRKTTGKEFIKKISEYSETIKLDLTKEYYNTEKLKQILENKGLLEGEFIDVTEGSGRPSYANIFIEAVNQLRKAPYYVIVQFGAGILCNETMDVVKQNKYKTKVIPVSVGRKDSIAAMLYGPYWVDVQELESKGEAMSKHKNHKITVYNLQDKEIVNAMKVIKGKFTAEPSGAAGFSILHRLQSICPEFDPKNDTVLVINTGNGLLNF